MSNMREFLDQMREEGRKLSGGSTSLGMVGKVLVQLGFHQYIKGQNQDFWYYWAAVTTFDEMEAKAAEVNGKLRQDGASDNARFGVRVTVFKDVLSSDQPYKKDISEFTAEWQTESFNLVSESIIENDLPLGEVFWGQVKPKANPFHVAKGEAGKTDKDQNGNPRYPAIRVPVKKFANEAEARAFVEANGAKSSDNLPPFSDTAKANYPDLQSLVSCAEEIHLHLSKAQKGEAFMGDTENYPLPKHPVKPDELPPPLPLLKKYIAGIYSIEASDIDLLHVEVPFG